jgi:hypothetical protein
MLDFKIEAFERKGTLKIARANEQARGRWSRVVQLVVVLVVWTSQMGVDYYYEKCLYVINRWDHRGQENLLQYCNLQYSTMPHCEGFSSSVTGGGSGDDSCNHSCTHRKPLIAAPTPKPSKIVRFEVLMGRRAGPRQSGSTFASRV